RLVTERHAGPGAFPNVESGLREPAEAERFVDAWDQVFTPKRDISLRRAKLRTVSSTERVTGVIFDPANLECRPLELAQRIHTKPMTNYWETQPGIQREWRGPM